MEQYRNQIDEILAKTGVDYRWLQGSGFSGLNDENKVSEAINRFMARNPNDPLTKAIRSRGDAGITEWVGRLRYAVNRLGGRGANGNDQYDADAINILTGTGQTPGSASKFEAGGTVSNPPPEAGDPREAQFRDYMTKFINRMNNQLTPDDPMYKQLTQLSQMGASRASQDVRGRGLRVGRGGLGELAIQQGAQNAVAPFEMQRAQMAQQAMGMLNSGNMGWEQMRQGAHSLALQEQGMQNQLNQAQYAQDADRAGGMGGLVGGIGGGVLGGLAALATGGAAAPLIPGLIQGGAAVGGSLGQSGVMRPRFGAVPRYRYGGGGGQGGGYA